ncbi:oxidoreductase [Pseudonocardia sp. CNS-139]|nr:oxidoreductase [Pseudonocardia sp. CNS-139]
MSGFAGTVVPAVTLNNGVVMPRLGLGVFRITPEEAAVTLPAAFAAGYRSIDTAPLYGNERAVGEVVARCGIPRDQLFVTTKLGNGAHGYDAALRAFDASTQQLGLDQVDLYLIHWPLPRRDRYVETWRALEKLLADGRTRAIGVSNFQIAHLERLAAETGTVPAVNQVELHPWFAQDELRAYHAAHGIATIAWGPLARGTDLLGEPLLAEIARRNGRTIAQVLLRWQIQLGNTAIPKSARPERIAENIGIFDFVLSAEDMARLATLETHTRIGQDPDVRDD